MTWDPKAIEEQSLKLIAERLGRHSFSDEEFLVVQRVIHATADFDFAQNIIFSPDAIRMGVKAIKDGKDIVADVEMVWAGINKKALERFGTKVQCFISHADVIKEAEEKNWTRAVISIRKAVKECPNALFVIGNSPTALLELIVLVKEKKAHPSLIVGVPVGFVSAPQAKEELSKLKEVSYITCRGNKGGSVVAVAIINALIKIAQKA